MEVSRRQILGAAAAGATLVPQSQIVRAGDSGKHSASNAGPKGEISRPDIVEPRSISGDSKLGPHWDEMFTLSVGNRGGVLNGDDNRVIQAAIDTVARMGGGTVRLLPGTFRLRNSIRLCSNLRFLGSGAETVLVKPPSMMSKLGADSDWYDREITLASDLGFQVGDGICLKIRDPENGAVTYIPRTFTARSGNRFQLDKGLQHSIWKRYEPVAVSIFSLLTGEGLENVEVAGLTIEGDKENNEELDGNYGGSVFLNNCLKVSLREVISRSFNGDGFSWQTSHDIIVENCQMQNHTGNGLHAGSGSQRTIVSNNRVGGCGIGIYLCWGIRFGLIDQNVVENSKHAGISIGHRDTDNWIRRNTILNSGEAGILFRAERGSGFTGDRNAVENNTVIDTGGDESAAIDVRGTTAKLLIRSNNIRETREPARRAGVRLGRDTRAIAVDGNSITGVAKLIDDQRTSSSE